MTSKDKLLNLLGLAMRARKLSTGEELVLNDVRSKRAKLVIISTDASNNTMKNVSNKCQSYQVALEQVCTRYELGFALGKDERVTIGVLDAGFAKSMKALIRDINEERSYE